MDQTKEPLLVVKGLKKHFPFKKGMFSKETGYVRAVDGVDFTVYRGETLGIVGESGCGKSTTGQMILQLLEPTEGEIWFEGRNLSTLGKNEVRTLRQHLQMIFQDPYSSLNPRMRVEDIVAEPLRVHGTHKGSELKEKVVELLRLVGLDAHHMSRHPHEFSGGQRQRIGIARALALNPSLIVCDEPVSALDVSIQSQVLNLLKKLQKELKLTYIFIAHGLPAVKHISDRIAVMYLGKIVELAERDELFANPRHPYTEALLSAVPIPDPTQRKERIVLQGDLPNPANPPSGCHFHTRCPYVQDVCRQTAPTLTEGAAGHFVSCHFPLAQSQEGVMG
ncbi:dipeptide ABC transporter ATP-binding protein [Brevibacillus borstelensis]|uniref:ABC transporter ATP-binding protein n=1 Tax=Brevibacillus borstelensis TaxID=45462 RepID=UPI001D0BCDF4|nr:dipeptide ABC transporter ATP-binding protein [Brevibacillus borstelensis]MCC0562789.1 dipeptide ABC transporter ATP-binding protein [Brevibacillus borstelensis]MED1853080.1 dipeptide ABC transporter ATP-binding protein [Brevibacillus borstelensis]